MIAQIMPSRIRITWLRITLLLIIFLIGIEGCVDVFMISLSNGAPITVTGSKTIDKEPSTDEAFVATSIDTLKSAGWWRDGASVIYDLIYKTECKEVNSSNGQWILLAFRQDRRTLFTSRLYEIIVNYSGDTKQINYTVEDYRIRKNVTSESIDFDNIRIWSKEALQLAEQNGGAEVRLVNDNKCDISISTDVDGVWEVDYFRESTFDRLLCLDIDQTSREVNTVPNRGDKTCLNQK